MTMRIPRMSIAVRSFGRPLQRTMAHFDYYISASFVPGRVFAHCIRYVFAVFKRRGICPSSLLALTAVVVERGRGLGQNQAEDIGGTGMQSKRWTVTYTKHMKQKRKVYHDGLLELCGSSGKVMLYDDCEKLIDSRFLKKDETVESGATMFFETHLVDIGNLDGNNKPSSKENIKLSKPISQVKKLASLYCGKRNTIHISQMKNHSTVLQKGSEVKRKFEQVDTAVLDGRFSANETSVKEWNVLYTNQMTQKAKKYHDGILKVLPCGSHTNQIILLNEDGVILSSKHMKSVEHVATGNKCELLNYLVEICEPRPSIQELGSDNICSSSKDKGMKSSMKPVQLTKTGKNENFGTSTKELQMDHSENPTIFCISKVDSLINPNTAVLRDALQILSVLKKPSLEENFEQSLEHRLISQSSRQCDVQVSGDSGTSLLCNLKSEFEKTGTSVQHKLTSEASQVASISAPAIVRDTDCEGCTATSDYLSSFSSGAVALTAPAKELNSENISLEQTCSTNNNSAVLGMSSKNMASDCTNQCFVKKEEAERGEAVHSTISATIDAASNETEDHEELTTVNDFPNFDLGF
ncbi:hypothetical protein HPP92_023789 [Vanilla planifolia]|uniref:5'-3' DNA helicase ZGRF1-like N-terminal domain-containing protein n=1 Tax=Vanilla planifolia TaxID=51239 RepID=A0A835PPJ3_VANPL|nr:hypothetical protein HPP92_023789 [Vanilla planifolia]